MRRKRIILVVVLVATVLAAALLLRSRTRPASTSGVVYSAGISAVSATRGIDSASLQVPVSPHARSDVSSGDSALIAEYRHEAMCRHFRQVLPFTGNRNQLAKDYLADNANFATPERRKQTSGIMDALEANQAFVDAHSGDCADATPLPDATFFEDAFAAASAGDIDAGNCWLRDRLTSEPDTALADPAFQTLLGIAFEHGDWAIVDMLESPVSARPKPQQLGGFSRHHGIRYSDPLREYRFARLARYSVEEADRGRTLDELLETQRAALDPKVADEADAWAADTFHRWFDHRATTRSQCPAE